MKLSREYAMLRLDLGKLRGRLSNGQKITQIKFLK